jgi:cytoskeletal protein CcmA (bactofilin family)
VTGRLLTVAPNGSVRASVSAGEVGVLGSRQGSVEGADKIYIRNGAQFVGDIHARGIVIEDGGFIRGKVDLSRNAGQ